MSAITGEQIQGWHVHRSGRKGRARAGKYSTLAVCGFTEGVIQAIPVAGTLTAELVTEIIENQVLPLLPCNSFLVADNASVYRKAIKK